MTPEHGDLRVGCFPYSPGSNPYQELAADAITSAGAEVVRIPPRKFMPLHWALSHPIDLLHLDWPHDFYLGRNWASARVKRWMYFLGCRKLKKFPLVWTAHNVSAHDAENLALERQMVQRLVDCCNGIVAMSHAAEEVLRDTYCIGDSTRVAVIPHGHYIDAYPNDVSQSEARERLGVPPEAKVILFFGRMRPYKGVVELLQAFATIDRPDAYLLLAGAPYPREFANQVRTLVENHPHRERIRLYARSLPVIDVQVYFNACDVVALPFREILNSGTLLLALSFGRCVIAPPQGSTTEVVPDDALFTYSGSEGDDLPNALRSALDASDILERGANARNHVRLNNDWQCIGRQFVDLHRTILQDFGSERICVG